MNYYNEALARYTAAAMDAGMSYHVANAVRRDAQRLTTIAVHECNGELERCEESEGPYNAHDSRGRPFVLTPGAVYRVWNTEGPGPNRYTRTKDMETPARARIDAAAASIGATVEYQGDPRGEPVTITLASGRKITPPTKG